MFTELFYNLLTFSDAAPNIFPLPLLIATLAMAFALTSLTFHYYPQATMPCCLVLLPLWYNPFFLQNLSYQYDGATIALSLVAVIFAITFRHSSRILQWLVPAFLIALALGLYQVSLNVFLGLCCLELLRGANDKWAWRQWYELIGWKNRAGRARRVDLQRHGLSVHESESRSVVELGGGALAAT